MPSFMEAATSAPPAATEIAPETLPAPTPAPESTPPPSTPPPASDAAADAKADLQAPMTREAEKGGTTPEKTTPAEKTTPTPKAKKDAPPTEAPEAAKPVETKPAEEVKVAPTAEQVKEEDLTPEEVAQIGKMTPKEMRAVFKARNKAERLAESRGVELEKALKQVKEVATLKATIAELEKRPTTEANDAKIAAAEAELSKRRADVEAGEKALKDRESTVKLREYATDVLKTEDYQTYVAKPAAKLKKDLNTLCRGAAADEESAATMYNQVIAALQIPDEAERWREVKKAIVDADPADKAKFAGIADTWNQILSNEQQLAGEADKAKKTVEEHATRQTEQQKKDTISRFQKAESFTKGEMEKTIGFLRMPLEDLPPEYQKLRTEWAQQQAEFDPTNVSPETIGALHQMAGSYQLATVVARDHIKALKANEAKIEKELADTKAELEEIKAGKQKVKDEEEEEERQAEEVTPNVGAGKDSRVSTERVFAPGESAVGGFSRSVYDSKLT